MQKGRVAQWQPDLMLSRSESERYPCRRRLRRQPGRTAWKCLIATRLCCFGASWFCVVGDEHERSKPDDRGRAAAGKRWRQRRRRQQGRVHERQQRLSLASDVCTSIYMGPDRCFLPNSARPCSRARSATLQRLRSAASASDRVSRSLGAASSGWCRLAGPACPLSFCRARPLLSTSPPAAWGRWPAILPPEQPALPPPPPPPLHPLPASSVQQQACHPLRPLYRCAPARLSMASLLSTAVCCI